MSLSMSSIASSGSNQEVTVSLMKNAKSQEEAVVGTLLEGVKATPQPEDRSMHSTGHTLNVTA